MASPPPLPPLPVDALVGDLCAALRERRAVVLRSPTGSGKTTRVPVALEAAGLGPVVLVEPRRVAARAAAARMAHERGERVGESVGYAVRFDRKVSARTRVTAVTEGLFLRRVLSDPFLEGVGCVVFDEFHERHLDGDLGLSLVRQVMAEARPDLTVCVLSATLEPAPLEAFLGAAVLDSPGRLHPVAVEHQEPIGRERLEEQVVRGVRRARAWIAEQGPEVGRDVLVFLPGKGEIGRAERALAARNLGPTVPLHGGLDAQSQDRALRPGPKPRIVLATNIAESSVTLDGLGAVVDTGLMRVPRLDERVGFDRLELTRIPMPSVEQRMGRAGRTGPGLNVRLWSLRDERDFLAGVEPEVARVDLSGALLSLADFGEPDPAAFAWFEAPPPARVASALELLGRLGGLDADRRLTALGSVLARLPIAPRLGGLLVAGARRGVLERAALAAALLSERDVLRRTLDELEPRRVHESDLLERIELLEGVPGFPRPPRWAASELQRVANQLVRQLEGVDLHGLESVGVDGGGVDGREAVGLDGREGPGGTHERAASSAADDEDEALLRALFDAFPDRVARVRPGGDEDAPRAVLVGGRGVQLGAACRVRASELLLALELVPGPRGEREDVVALASVVRRAWLGELVEAAACEVDEASGRVLATRALVWNGLVVEEKPGALEGAELQAAREEALARYATQRGVERVFGTDAEAATGLAARVAHARAQGADVPAFEPASFAAKQVVGLVRGCKTLADLAAVDLAGAYLAGLAYDAKQALEAEAPARVKLPNGETAAVRYDPERGPILAARIQQLFGWQATPTIGRARVPLLLELCAPNGRPQQITSDLAGFWSGSYALVRKDLRGRYPKHPWPEDPASAAPVPPRRRRR